MSDLHLHGNRSRFALGFALREDPDIASAPGRRFSYGALQLWVRDRNLTLGRDGDNRILTEAEVPLLPLAAWLIRQWDPLFHEERLPRRTDAGSSIGWYLRCLDKPPADDLALDELLEIRERWWHRHGLGSALPDFRVPDLHIRRFGEQVELSWDDEEWRSVPGGVSLVEEPGLARLPAREVAEALHAWCDDLLTHLYPLAKTQPALKAELDALLLEHRSLDDPGRTIPRLSLAAGDSLEIAAKRLRLRLGVTGGSVEETVSAMFGLGLERPERSLVVGFTPPVLLFRSTSPTPSADDLYALLRLAERRPGGASAPIGAFMVPMPVPLRLEAATEDGYRRALSLRDLLGVDPSLPLTGDLDLEVLLRDRLGVVVEGLHLDDPYIEGVAVAGAGVPPTIAVNLSGRFTRTSWGRRMTLAHELCHLLHDVTDEGLVGVVSGAWADRGTERRANAFAAMLLAPEAALDRWLGRDVEQWTTGRLRAAMAKLGIGVTTLTFHLHNLGWITDADRSAWMQELTDLG